MDRRLTREELYRRVEEMQREREASYNAWLRSMEKHARCVLLPSPDMLSWSMNTKGSDEIDTLGDFRKVKAWVTREKLLNDHDLSTDTGEITDGKFGSLVLSAFNFVFTAMRHTGNPELQELVFWYYTGHGLGKEKAKYLSYIASPVFEGTDYNNVANDFVKEGEKVKGGELCLHQCGFCGLSGLLKPWIAAVKSKSQNAKGMTTKKNKQLLIILDSCHSGIIAEDLKEFKTSMDEKDPDFLKENTVTVMAACGPDETTYGGYFTPLFLYLNDPDNNQQFEELKNKWREVTDEMKNEYRQMDYPSPMVVTTASLPEGSVTMPIEVQGLKLTLFADPGFFKFCYESLEVELALFVGKSKVLDSSSAQAFMKSGPFTVLDFKLKKYQTGIYSGTPMGLFLLEDKTNSGYVVCAHIHFEAGYTSKWNRINLVHHTKLHPPPYPEDGHKIQLTRALCSQQEEEDLVKACKDYVEKKRPGWWSDLSKWNMQGHQLGINGLFKLKAERSAREDEYLTYIEKFNLPKVDGNNLWD